MRTRTANLVSTIIALCLVLGFSESLWAGEKPLSPEAQELKGLLSSLKNSPRDKTAQLRYLQKFPKDMASFRRLFDQPDFSELYREEADYVFALRDLAGDHPAAVGQILVGLGKDASAGPDALSDLQQVIAEYAINHTTVFAKLLKECSAKEAADLIRYLADVENHAAYPEYPQIIANLHKANEAKLAQQFEAAKSERMKRKGD